MPHNRVTLFDLIQKASKHRLFIESAIVAKTIFIEIGLQVALANRMINAPQTVLYQTPKSLKGIRMDVANDVDLGDVIDAAVIVLSVSDALDSIIGNELVGKHGTLGKNMFPSDTEQGAALYVISDQCFDSAPAFDYSNDGSLCSVSGHRTPSAPFSPPAHVSFIHFDAFTFSSEWWRCFLLIQHGSNLPEHSPSGFVGDSSLPLNLLRGNAATCLGHKVDRIEPSSERSRGLVEDRASGRVDVMTAMIARVRRSAHNAVVLGHSFTLLAINAIRVEAIAKPFKAGRVIRELALEVFQSVWQHFRLAVVMGHLVTYCQVKPYQMAIPTVKG
jgi:hypothetical protein